MIADHVATEKTADEQIATHERERNPRFGFKTGLAIGMAIVIAIASAVK